MAYVGFKLGDEDIFKHTIQILLDHREKGLNHGNQPPPSIYMVPSVFRDLSPGSFNPRVVSIGPLHKDDKKLQGYEEHKVTYLQGLLGRLDTPTEQTLKTCLWKVNTSIDKVRACYSGMNTYTDVELSEMMVVLFLNSFSDIFECTVLKFRPATSLINLILSVLNFVNLFDEDLKLDNIGVNTTHDHILGILRKCYEPTHVIPLNLARFKKHTAVELEREGVNFKPKRHKNWPLAIELELSRFPSISWCWGKPTLKMLVLCVHDFTELVLRNLIAYEQCSGVPSYISSYAVFMDMIVDNQEDVAKLVEWDVFDNSLGSHEEAANMINRI